MSKKQRGNKNLLEVQNAAKTLFANIRFQSIDKPIWTIAITSSVPDEGKTTAAWYLAQAAATAGYRVLLVEADMRRRSLASMLDLHPKNGLVALLMGNVLMDDAIVPTSVKGLFFLDAEPSVPNPADLLATRRMAELNEKLSKSFDYIIYDTPPVGTFVDAAVLGTIVDGTILAVRSGMPKRTELQRAYEQLESAGANIIGICSTFEMGSGSDYYYSYYTKGERRKKESLLIDASAEASGGDKGGIASPEFNDALRRPAHGGYGYSSYYPSRAGGEGISHPRNVRQSDTSVKPQSVSQESNYSVPRV